ncbi:XTP/dITP diphosphatase [Paenibacillus sp. GYB003]|uniref:XTP/dITP diphosphatase n=1 Tax=Paenibacillus sp. GYB003 TaxID=2994392 RepID=UPI002F961289
MRLTANDPVVIATRNAGKAREFAALFEPLGIAVRSLNDYPQIPDIVEDGETFRDNALIKARTVAERLGVPALADDSGLCVDKLGGAPGVYSARYAGAGATDADNNAKLLGELGKLAEAGDTPAAAVVGGREVRLLSKARFVCALALFVPGKPPLFADGAFDGFIVDTPLGDGGFGYDPLFYAPEYGATLAQLPLEAKNAVSHRAQALRKLRELIAGAPATGSETE